MIHFERIERETPGALRVLAITDMHIGDSRLSTSDEQVLDLTLDVVTSLRPDMVVNCGDIVAIDKDQRPLHPGETWQERLRACWRLYTERFVAACPAPVLDVCLERDKPFWAETRSAFFSHGYECDDAKCTALCLREDLTVEPELLAEIESHVAGSNGLLILAMHYPVEGIHVRETTVWVRQGRELKDLIKAHCRMGIILAGHWHGEYFRSPPAREENTILCFAGEAGSVLDNAPWGKLIDCRTDETTVSHVDFASGSITYRYAIT